ncbi:hypothetical protein EHQ23_02370 [Leptospira bourretii]|uniref:Uncharacterized protein n=1 Tax=Leptospira bourretii TaxID=2484962 RepID=A0A4R9IMI9_9LEPT|nr:hypothetical protein [Leptospira bourretii]TGK89981.1 hypothetical protein EHQ23_02370 [Leptospira bourretii]TGK92204.1 hypothetical protein EHQ26_09515 [Leptospira bourretii]TGL27483.1 hypothetical protein EHQ45_17465 [Leptospira bourretii]
MKKIPIILILFILFCNKNKEANFTLNDISKFKHLANRNIDQSNGSLSLFKFGCSYCSISISNDNIISSGYLQSRDVEDGKELIAETQILKLKLQNNQIIPVKMESREPNKQEEQEFKYFETLLTYPNFIESGRDYNKEIVSLLPAGVRIINVLDDDLNNDSRTDYITLYSFPIDEDFGQIVEQIQIAIFLSQGNDKHLNLYDKFLGESPNNIIVDIAKVKLLASGKQYLIREVSRGKSWSGGFHLIWIKE